MPYLSIFFCIILLYIYTPSKDVWHFFCFIVIPRELWKNNLELGIPLSVMFGNQYMISLLLHLLFQLIQVCYKSDVKNLYN